MSDSDSGSNAGEITSSPANIKSKMEEQQKETVPSSSLTFDKELKLQVKKWFLNTLGPILIIVQVTIIFIVALLADTIIIVTPQVGLGLVKRHQTE